MDDRTTSVAIVLLILLVLIALNSGCSTVDNKPKCTWICPTNNIPKDCYCLEEEIGRETKDLSHP